MAETNVAQPISLDPSRRRRLAEFWYYFSENRGAVIGFWLFVLLVIVALLAPVIAPHLPYAQYRDAVLVPPFWEEGGRAAFPLGTDPVGRDILSRLLYGAQYSLFIGVVVTTIALVGGIVIGVIAGYFGGWIDTVIMRIMDIILAFPSLLLALVLVAVLGPGLTNAMIAIALVLQPHFVRLTRAAVMTEKGREYVTAARVSGAGSLRLMFRTILPNCHGAADRAGDALLLQRHPRRRRTRLPRHGRAAADARMGHDAGRGARVHPARLVGRHLPRPCHPDHRSGDQSDRRRPARRARSQAEEVLNDAAS